MSVSSCSSLLLLQSHQHKLYCFPSPLLKNKYTRILTLLFHLCVPMKHDEFLIAPILIRALYAITHCSPLVYTNNAIFFLKWNPFGSCCSWHLKCLPPVENLQGADIISIADECVTKLGPTKTICCAWAELRPEQHLKLQC